MTADVTARPDTYEMVFVHNCFRRQFHALPGLVLGVPDGDTTRARTVVGFVDELTAMLHHHHSGEDDLMWPLLLERAPMDSALILRMEEQHERIAEIYQQAGALGRAFAASADPTARQELAQALTDLAAYPRWNPLFPEASGQIAVGSRLTLKTVQPNGRTMTIKPKILAVKPNAELRWSAGLPGIIGGEHSFTLTPADGGARLVQSETFRGLLVPFSPARPLPPPSPATRHSTMP